MLMVQPLTWGTPGTDWLWAHSLDGQTCHAHGQDATALLPADPAVVLVLPVLATSWHRVTVPKIAPVRMRQALDGLLEDRLLAEPATLHLALQPQWQAGQTAWVMACDKATLQSLLGALQAAGRPASRIVPDVPPQPTAAQYALMQRGQPWLVRTGAWGVWVQPLAAAPMPMPGKEAPTGDLPPCQAEPACAAVAEAALGQPCVLQPAAERLLQASQSGWNAAQFDLRLSASARRGQRLREAWLAWAHGPAWRPTRWGLGVCALSALVGLNALAWQERAALQAKQQQAQRMLTQTFPQVTLVLDAPRQMARELAQLQRANGQLGQGDIELLLADFSAALPNEQPLTAIHFTQNEAQLTLKPLTDAQLDALRQGLRQRGWQTQYSAPVLTATPARP